MDFSERNRNNVISRWRKIHQKDILFINKNKFLNLKSRIFGFMAGDGNILLDNGSTCRHNTIRFFPDHLSMVKSFEDAMLKVYNKKPKIKKRINHFEVTLDSKPVVKDLLKYGKFGVSKWNIPPIVFNSKENEIEWLKAYFDCEAYVHPKHIRVKSVNKKGLNQVKRLLSKLGINSKIYEYQPKNINHKTNYMINIGKREDRKKYMDIIGFNHTIKFKKLNKFLNLNAAIA